VVVFTDRERRGEVRFGRPRVLSPTDPQVKIAMEMLGIGAR
jgi:hypothetical protein